MNVKILPPNIYYGWCVQIAVDLEDVWTFLNTVDLSSRSETQRRVNAKAVILQQKNPTEGPLTGTTKYFNMK